MTPELSIVIPAYCEADKIQADILAAGSFLGEHFRHSSELIVVDDGSSDATAERARDAAKSIHVLTTVIALPDNRGKGHALRAGIARSSGRRVLFADAGLCVPFEDCLLGLELLDDPDLALGIAHGSRRTPSTVVSRRQPLYRRAGSRVFRTLVGFGMGVPSHLRDTQCGFKVYDGEIARQLYRACFTDGFMFDIEVIRRARRANVSIREFPVRWKNDADTRFAPVRGSLRNFRELARIRLRA